MTPGECARTALSLLAAFVYDPEGTDAFEIVCTLDRDDLIDVVAVLTGMLAAAVEDSCNICNVDVETWLQAMGQRAAAKP